MDFNKLIKKEKFEEFKKNNPKIYSKLINILKDPFHNKPSLELSVEISKEFNLALHPKFTLYWLELSNTKLVEFLENLKNLKIKFNEESKEENFSNIKFSYIINNKFKENFENLALEHKVKTLNIDKIKSEKETSILIFNELNTKILLYNLGINPKNLNQNNFKEKINERIEELIEFAKKNLEKNSLEIINFNNPINIRDKAGTYIGARMGRPEKAKMRKQFNKETKSHSLFPVGEGIFSKTVDLGSNEDKKEITANRNKNIIESFNTGYIEENFRIYYCENCNKEVIYPKCPICHKKTKIQYFEKYTGKKLLEENEKSVQYKRTKIDLDIYEKELRNILGPKIAYPKLVKGIKETINKHHTVEHISKGFFRAINNVYVNKDGTIRYDMIEMGLTHFKPKEIGTSIEKLKELGYKKDYFGNPLENEEQIIEIFPQDVILPDCPDSPEEKASEFILNTGNYVDDLLEHLYKLPRFYNFKTKEDTIGHLIIGLAPHTSAGIIGRIIGYSKTQGCFSHPVWHAAQRRNLDGDENGIMLLLDGLINFSREYLPDRRGSRSVTEDTILFLRENNKIKCEKIGEYIDTIFQKEGYNLEEDGFETKEIKNLEVLSFNPKNKKINFEKVSKIIRHKCDKKIFEIKTSDGWIKTTEDHSIFSINIKNGEIIEKKASELKKGDFIIGVNKINSIEKNVTENLNILKIGIEISKNSKKIKKIIKLDKAFYRLLGFILAEGYINKNKIEIGNTNKKIIEIIKKDIKKITGIEPNIFKDKREFKYTNKNYYRISLNSNLVKILKRLGLKEKKSQSKEIPPFVFNSEKKNIKSFIEGFLLGDGTSYLNDNNRNMIRLYTSSIKLASGLSLLAYLIGKKSTCRYSKEKRTNDLKYEICISNFKKRSSFWSLYYLKTQIRNGLKKSNIEAKKINSIMSNIYSNKRIKSASKEKIKKIINLLKINEKENFNLIKILNKILNQDLRLEIVNELKEVKYSDYVYDLEVPKYQNFLCGPHPIFAHNTMDVSLVLTSHLYLDQIDDEVHGMDIVDHYPLEFYKATKEYKSPKEVKIEKLGKRVYLEDIDSKYLGYKFTHGTDNMNNTILISSYKSIPSMAEKLEKQLEIGKMIRAVNKDEVGNLIIDKHFMKDIKGNLRKFGMQTFRCAKCNTIYRRPPLSGKCTHCGNYGLIFTISEGSVKKYVNHSFNIIKEFHIDPYIKECIELVDLRIKGVFGEEKEKQKSLNDFFK